MEYSEAEKQMLREVLPGIAVQLRGALANIHLPSKQPGLPQRPALRSVKGRNSPTHAGHGRSMVAARNGHHGQCHRAGLLQDATHRPALRQAGSRRGSRPANHHEPGGLRGRYPRVDHVPRFPRVRLYHGAGHPHRWRLDRHIGESQRAE